MAAHEHVNEQQFHMHMYHGTSGENATKIKKEGLGEHLGQFQPVYVTHDYELAEYYASMNKSPAIVKVRVNPRNLQVDWNSFEEPVHTSINRNFDESKLRTEYKLESLGSNDSSDWKNSLRQTGSALHWGHIPPKNILEVEHL